MSVDTPKVNVVLRTQLARIPELEKDTDRRELSRVMMCIDRDEGASDDVIVERFNASAVRFNKARAEARKARDAKGGAS